MTRCAFLVKDTIVDDDALAIGPLHALGWDVEAVPWRQSDVDWRAFDLVIIRSAWDYHLAPDAFLAVLAAIDGQALLANHLDLVRWNSRKTYLRDLQGAGIPVVPTVFPDDVSPAALERLFDDLACDDLVVKPVVGASAAGIRRVRRGQPIPSTGSGPYMVQPMVPSVMAEGEYSLFYFAGSYSHAVQKSPARGDFRVQEEHGGRTVPVQAGAGLRRAADLVLDALEDRHRPRPLYARVDLVRARDGEGYWLMELELIEPVLYLGVDPGAPARLAAAVDRWWAERQ